ncbi:unnamed protein product [Effrenium voratum]|nr:unnamed protein product [Effrenium voratum]
MSEASASNLSSASSRSEHMAYLMNDLSLDRATASLMYRAERLQEKGQLQQALKYFERVLATQHCEEAAVNARMIREQLAEVPRLESVREEAANAVAARLQTADMPVTFTVHDVGQHECCWTKPMLRDEVLEQAKRDLQQAGIKTPFLELVSLDIEEFTPDVHIDPWMDTQHTCRAVVRVTLLPGMAASLASNAPAAANAAFSPALDVAAAAASATNLAEVLGILVAAAPEAGEARAREPDCEPSVREASQQSCAAAAAEHASACSSGSRRSVRS